MAYISKVYCQLNGKVYQSEPRGEGTRFCSACDVGTHPGCRDATDKTRVCTTLRIIWKEVIPNESQV